MARNRSGGHARRTTAWACVAIAVAFTCVSCGDNGGADGSTVSVPRLIGKPTRDAETFLDTHGIRARYSNYPDDADVAGCRIGGQRPIGEAPADVTVVMRLDCSPHAGASCHPSYDPCLKISSLDYDCLDASNDGPDYTSGPVTVKGPDQFDLDPDGDGVACQGD